MLEFEKRLDELNAKDLAGTLTVGEALIGSYYRLLDGPDAGRVIIKCHDTIDGCEIVRFANGLTWAFLDKLAATRCESAYPSFNPPRRPVDYSQATWYGDDGSEPLHHEW